MAVESAVESSAAAATAADAGVHVELTDDEQKAIGVQTTEVTRRTIHQQILAPGKVAEPETGIGTISARISGRIDKLFLNTTGDDCWSVSSMARFT